MEKLATILTTILRQPTAPFHEYHVRGEILRLLSDCPHVATSLDAFGNLLATYRRGETPSRWVFGAHMDHPGWVRKPDGSGGFEFLGSVPKEYLAEPARVEFGDFAMWDLPAVEIEDGILHSRACDDLVGCAVIVSALRRLEDAGGEASVHAVFTRAEEVGFVGAAELAQSWPFSDESVFVSLETSAPRGSVLEGAGPVVRVGDRVSVFDPSVTAEILSVAEAGGIPVQRALLDGGSCEASAFQAYGIRSAGISIPLGNYHNCGGNGVIAPERVALADVEAMTEVVLALAMRDTPSDDPYAGFRERFETRRSRYAAHIEATR